MGDDSDGETDGRCSKKMPILNSCLCLIKHLMVNKDKSYIQDAICSRFTLDVIKSSFKTLYCHVYPDDVSNYRGPHKGSNRDKQVHAFGEIYKLFQQLDAQNKVPVVACPSDELNLLLSASGTQDFYYENRLRNVESQLSRLQSIEKSMSDLKSEMQQLSRPERLKPILPCRKDPIPERLRQNSMSSIKSAVSAASSKRQRIESDTETLSSDDDENKGFQIPKYHKKKDRNREQKGKISSVPSYSEKLQTTSDKSSKRRPAVWGKADSSASHALLGAVPDIFMFNISGEPTEDMVSSYLTSCSINVKKVKLVSHANAYKRSFKVSVGSYADFDSLMSGEVISRGIGVRKFIPPRFDLNKTIADSRSRENKSAPELDKSSAISQFIQQSEEELKNLNQRSLNPASNGSHPSVIPVAMDTSIPSSTVSNNKSL